jgi:hypothetical protein
MKGPAILGLGLFNLVHQPARLALAAGLRIY